MDLSFYETLIPDFARFLGVHPSTVLFTIMVVSANAHVIAKLIPDDATGWKSYVRQVCKILGLVVSNRIKEGVSQVDISKQIIGEVLKPSTRNKIVGDAADAAALVPQVVDEITDDSPRLVRDPLGQYARKKLLQQGDDL